MNTIPSEPIFFNRICREGIFVEFLVDYHYTLTEKSYPLPDSNLKYECITLTSDHLPIASGLFRWFRSAISHCDLQNGRELVNEMVRVFRHYKEEFPIPLREYVLSNGLIEVCFKVQIDDDEQMKQILDLLYENWSCFGSLHFSAILKPSNSQSLLRKTNANSNPADFLSFYLEHARRLKLEYNGVRFIDVSVYSSIRKAPVFISADIWCWKPLLRYLQFGANFEDVMVDPSTNRHGVQFALTDTLRNLISHLWILLVQPAADFPLTDPKAIKDYCIDQNSEVYDLCHTLTIILRAVKHLRHGVLEFVIRHHSNEEVVLVNSYTVVNHPIVNWMIPTLKQRYKCPMQLQHACRYAIRNRLNMNWQLPVGIINLPIPNKMKKYLNLLSD